MKAFYFGTIGDGHHFYGPDGATRPYGDFDVLPWKDYEIDDQLQPHFADCAKKKGEPYCACTRGPEGVASLHHKMDQLAQWWTALSMWDRSVDKRGAANSTFIFEGLFSFKQALDLTKEHFPSIVKRFTFEITPAE